MNIGVDAIWWMFALRLVQLFAEEDEALGKKADKYGKKGNGKIKPDQNQGDTKSFTHQTCRNILVQKQSEALRISQEIHDGKITFNEAAFNFSEAQANA